MNSEKHHSPKRVYPEMPLIGVGAVVQMDNKILLIQRANEPGRGLWSIPGGLLEVGETLKEAAKREVEEETGIPVEIGELIDVVENIIMDEDGRVKFHYVLIDFRAKPLSEKTEIKPSSEVLEARWFTPEEIKNIPLTRTAKLLLKKIGIQL
ncbi:NUDIX hydrolase [Candidatus Bathyarchaeota archaeon]|nr:NUDIX hydrolase [Candidatus Bathyarchaeota archaeon]